MQTRAPLRNSIGTHASGVLAQNQHAGSVRTHPFSERTLFRMTIRKAVFPFLGSASVAFGFLLAVNLSAAAKTSYGSMPSQATQTLSIPPDSPRWNLEGQAKPADYQGRKSLFLDGGGATLKDFEMRYGVIDVDVATPAARGFSVFNFGSPATMLNGFICASIDRVRLTRCSTRRS